MTTYVLDGKSAASLPRRPLAVRMATAGGAPLSARLDIRAAGTAPRVISQAAGLLIVPRVDAEVTIVAVPEAGRTRFDPGTILHVSFGPESFDDPGADTAQLTPRDVSGMSFIELATIAPGGPESIIVQTRLAIPDAPLPPLATKARVACRSVLRADQVPETDAVSVHCIVDTSASMARLFATGVVAAAGEVIAGIAAVIGRDPTITCSPAGASTTSVTPADLPQLLSAPPSSGFGFIPPLTSATPVTSPRSLTIIVTDAPVDPASAVGARTPTAILLLSAARSVADRPGFVGAVLAPPLPGAGVDDVRRTLDDHPDQLTAIVAGLLAPTGLTGTDLTASPSGRMLR